jgi:hypothetical protein
MALSGSGAMVLYYDIVPAAVEDHDDWHTHEHFPERLAIPGFLRGSRWLATGGGPRYLVIYEVVDVAVLSDGPYLERLNNPTPWTTRMMQNFRGMVRGFCSVTSSSGSGLGNALFSVRYSPMPDKQNELRDWLRIKILPSISGQPGVVSAHMLEPAAKPPMTKEQTIRGQDAEMPWVLLVTAYSPGALTRIAGEELGTQEFERHGAGTPLTRQTYGLDILLTERERARA